VCRKKWVYVLKVANNYNEEKWFQGINSISRCSSIISLVEEEACMSPGSDSYRHHSTRIKRHICRRLSGFLTRIEICLYRGLYQPNWSKKTGDIAVGYLSFKLAPKRCITGDFLTFSPPFTCIKAPFSSIRQASQPNPKQTPHHFRESFRDHSRLDLIIKHALSDLIDASSTFLLSSLSGIKHPIQTRQSPSDSELIRFEGYGHESLVVSI